MIGLDEGAGGASKEEQIRDERAEYSANMQWLIRVDDLLNRGDECAPRGMAIREFIGTQFVYDPCCSVITVPGRKMHYPFLFGEAWWILSGKDDVPSIEQYNRHIRQFSDDGERFFGAYGPKITNQLDSVIGALARDKDSRQAVINIWRENPPNTKDVPCTLNLQFLIRNDTLITIINMRSSDAWLGLVYDVFNFAMVSVMVYLRLKEFHPDLCLGRNAINIGSSHIYERDFDKARLMLEDTSHQGFYFGPDCFHGPQHLVDMLKCAANEGKNGLKWFQENL